MLKKLNDLPNYLVLLFAIIFGLKFIQLAKGNILNYYTFISQDGFDWYVEGLFLTQDKDLTLPVLRPPVFVILSSIDSLLQQGVFLAGIFSLCIYFSYRVVIEILRLNKVELSFAIKIFVAVSFTIAPINYVRVYLLSDSVAVLLSIIAVYFFIKHKNNNSLKELVLSLTIGVLAGLTQTYGLIPLVICIFYDFYKNHKIKKNLFLLGVWSIIFISLLVLWRQKIPHLDTPNNFNLLKLSNDNFNYYANTWTFFLYPLIFFILLRLKIDNIKKLLINEFFLIVLMFCCLAYFYQWQDSRFTFYFWPFLIIYLSVQLQDKIFHKYFAVLSLIFALLSPNSYWSAEVKSLSTNPSNNWVVQFFSASSADRKITQCDLECLKNNEFYQNGDMYIKSVLNTLGKF